jgi:hypothetical protein
MIDRALYTSLGICRICIFIIFIFISFSCKDKTENCTERDYDECYTSRPEYGMAEIMLTLNSENPKVTFRIYEGNFEDGKLLLEEDVAGRMFTEYLAVEKQYSFTATYKNGRENILAVDGGKIKITSYQMCEYKCYEARVLKIDLRID